MSTRANRHVMLHWSLLIFDADHVTLTSHFCSCVGSIPETWPSSCVAGGPSTLGCQCETEVNWGFFMIIMIIQGPCPQSQNIQNMFSHWWFQLYRCLFAKTSVWSYKKVNPQSEACPSHLAGGLRLWAGSWPSSQQKGMWNQQADAQVPFHRKIKDNI